MRYWLMKSEPSEFSIDDLVAAPRQTTGWFGVRNYQARNFMRDIRDQGKVIGTERIAVMAALNIAHELLTTRVPGGFDVGEVKRRMRHMQSAIDAALSSQDKLF